MMPSAVVLTPEESPAQAPAAPACAAQWDAFLRAHAQQPMSTMRYELGGQTVWVKTASRGNPRWIYGLLRALAMLLRAPVLQPVPNPGGAATIATEVQRLRRLAAAGLRVPEVLAANEQAFAMRDLGHGAETASLSARVEDASRQSAEATLTQWQRGLQALGLVHARGECLSQAVARNLVCCPDGAIGFIDFEDDPAGTLPLPVCHARDALNYAQSTALFLQQGGALAAAQPLWQAFVHKLSPEAQQALRHSVARLAWIRFLPRDRSLGRDAQRARSAYSLLSGEGLPAQPSSKT